MRAWFRGPLATHPTLRDQPRADGTLPFAHTSDQLRRVVPDGREDLSLAAAFEVGRLLALSQPSFVRALLAWRTQHFVAERARETVNLTTRAATHLTDVLKSRAPDLGQLLAKHFVLAAAADPAKVFAPSRPLVDPGAPLPFGAEGSLEEIVAAGFGFSAEAITAERTAVGTIAALQRAEVPVIRTEQPSILQGLEIERLSAALQNQVDRLSAQSLKSEQAVTARRSRKASAKSAPDALDELIARAETDGGQQP